MKIVRLTAENVKRLKAVEITPDGSLVQVTGKNEAGKTSVLDSIWWALAGRDVIQGKPIRDGESDALVELDLGEMIVKREFRERDGKPYTTRVFVETPEGARFQSPQTKVLDTLLDSLAFDPLEFARMKPESQYTAVKELVGLDFDDMQAKTKEAFDERRIQKRLAKESATLAEGIDVPEAPDGEAPDLTALRSELSQAEDANTRRTTLMRARDDLNAALEGADQQVATAEKYVASSKQMLKNAEQQLADAQSAREDAKGKIMALPEIPMPVDIVPLEEAIEEGRDRQHLMESRARAIEERDGHLQRAEAAAKEAAALTQVIEGNKAEATKQIEAAKMPLEGMSLANGQVTYDGIPFDQLSSARQVRISCAMAMSGDPKLRVVLIRNGNDLDSDSLAEVAAMAEAHDFQVWMERVDESGAVGFVIEDGQVAAPKGEKTS